MTKPVRQHTFCGSRYRIIHSPPARLAAMAMQFAKGTADERPERLWGLTDAPTVRRKAIRIAHGQTGRELLDTHIHEGLHACSWDLAEDFVTQAAKDIARYLHRLGYRKIR